MNMRKLLKNNGKKIMAVASAVLMITFFFPNLRGGGHTPEEMAARTVATVYDGQKITAMQQNVARQEWDWLSRHLSYQRDPQDAQPLALAALFYGNPNQAVRPDGSRTFDGQVSEQVFQEIGAKQDTFMLLVQEAHQLGIQVSNDELQTLLNNHIVGFPDDSDPGYDVARQAIFDWELVRNLLSRVADTAKISDPRSLRLLAVAHQEVSLNLVQISASPYMPATVQPTDKQIQQQYDGFSQILRDSSDIANPLGFGYCYPDRAQVQYLGFTVDDLRQQVKQSRPAIEWDTQARRLYRTHTDQFPTTQAVAGPTTQPAAAPAWEDLSAAVQQKVFDQVYLSATDSLAKKVLDHVNGVLASDWVAYSEAAKKGSPPPLTALGVTYISDKYLRLLAASVERDYGVYPTVGNQANGWKTASQLNTIPGIGSTTIAAGEDFGDYAIEVGDQFASAQKLSISERLALWQPSQLVVGGLQARDIDSYYIFRLSGMDPTHPAPLSDVRDQVIEDLRTQQAWDQVIADVNKIHDLAAQVGLAKAAKTLSTKNAPVDLITTDYFNLEQAAELTHQIPGLAAISPRAAAQVAGAAIPLVAQSSGDKPAVAQVNLGLDRMVVLVELNKARPAWQDPSEKAIYLISAASDIDEVQARQLVTEWSSYDAVAKRTQFKDLSVKE